MQTICKPEVCVGPGSSLKNIEKYVFSPKHHHAFSAELALVSSLATENCASAVIIFNMSLALQLQGMYNLCPLKKSFSNTLRYYRIASQILEISTDSDDEVNFLVYLALANNM